MATSTAKSCVWMARSACSRVESHATHCSVTPSAYARRLLDSLGLSRLPVIDDQRDPHLLWAQSGAMYLSGHTDGAARACPAPLASCAQGVWLALSALGPAHCNPHFDAYRLLGERAAIAGLQRRGRLSAGGACHLLDTLDGVLALNLARADDFELMPAWLERSIGDASELASLVRELATEPLLHRARLLGLAAARVAPPQPCPTWFHATQVAPAQRVKRDSPVVVDLSALWAGPLCAQMLADCGARVIKVESITRPDGARFGLTRFYNLLNASKESVALDFKVPADRARLRALLACADIVIESTRPRALEQMDICAAELIAANPGMVWLGITGYGRREPQRDWIAYGDDAGVAAGLSWLMGGDCGDPVFCGDAIADPLTGLHAALLALAVWQQGGGQLLDVALHDVVAYCIATGSAAASIVTKPEAAELPVARVDSIAAVELGAHTEAVLKEFL